MALSCQEVWKAISSYIDGDLDAALRAKLEAHLEQCRHCTALLDSTRNVIVLVADERVFEIPVGFSERLHARLERELGKRRRR